MPRAHASGSGATVSAPGAVPFLLAILAIAACMIAGPHANAQTTYDGVTTVQPAPADAAGDDSNRNIHLERCVPASTQVLFRWPGKGPMNAESNAMARIMAEPEVQKFFEKAFATDKASGAVKGWIESMQKDPQGINVTGGGYCMRFQGNTPVPEMAWTFHSDSDPAPLVEFCKGFLGGPMATVFEQFQPGLQFRLRPLEGANIDIDESPGPQPKRFELFYTTWGSSLLMTTTESYARDILGRAKGGRQGETLADSAAYRRVLDTLEPEPSSFVAFINVDGFFSVMPAAAKRNRALTGFDGLHAVGFTVTPDERGLKERYYVDAPAPRKGMLEIWSMSQGGTESARYGSPKTVVYSNVHLDIPTMYRAFTNMYSLTEPAEYRQYDAKLQRLEKAIGFSIAQDLIPTLGGEMAFLGSLESGPVPDVIAAIRLKDPARYKELIDRALAAIPEVTVQRVDYLGRELVFIPQSFGGQASGLSKVFISSYLRPHYCIDGDYLLIGLLPQSLKNAIRRAQHGPNLSTAPRFVEALRPYKDQQVGTTTFVELGALVHYAYAALPMVQAGQWGKQGQPSFDLASMPSANTITKHLYPMTIVGSSNDQGILMDTDSPFGSTMLMGFSSSLLISAWTKPIPAAAPVVQTNRGAPMTFDQCMEQGDIARINRRFTDAIRCYRKALRLSEEQPERRQGQLHFYTGWVLRETGSNQRAMKHFEEAIDRQYFVGECYYFLATLLARTGDLDGAVDKLNLAVDNGWRRFETLKSADFAKLRTRPKYREFTERISARRQR